MVATANEQLRLDFNDDRKIQQRYQCPCRGCAIREFLAAAEVEDKITTRRRAA
jgi:hypothetical protein